MRLRSWPEMLLNPDVKLPDTNSEPATATRAQRFGFFDPLQPKHLTEECAGFGFASLWSRELKMVDISHEHPPIMPQIFKPKASQANAECDHRVPGCDGCQFAGG